MRNRARHRFHIGLFVSFRVLRGLFTVLKAPAARGDRFLTPDGVTSGGKSFHVT